VSYHTIEDGPWPQGVTVAVYPVASVDVGSPIDTAIAQPDGTATFGGLTEGAQYTAVGSGGTQTFYARNQESALGLVENKIVTADPPTGVPTTDRLALQAALNALSAGDVLRLFPGSTYTVNSAGTAITPSHGATAYSYCLIIPSGVTLDLNGATLQLAAGVKATIVRGPTTGGTNIGLVGFGTIAGNGTSATATTDGFAVWFDGITGLTLDVKVNNTTLGAVVFEGCSKINAPRIVVDG
jgi:hypothetical protein